jgi:hypothetical protein
MLAPGAESCRKPLWAALAGYRFWAISLPYGCGSPQCPVPGAADALPAPGVCSVTGMPSCKNCSPDKITWSPALIPSYTA